MIDWERLTLLLYILMRMTGFVVFSPILGRRGIPGIVRAGMIMVLTFAVTSFTTQTVNVPLNLISFGVILFLELSLGYLLGFVMQLFFYIPMLAGDAIDSQMGFTMGKTYDAGAQASMSVTSTLFTIFMFLLFFAANGHHTLMRILITSGDIVPFGTASFGPSVSNAIVELFISCTILGVKLCLPILAAELMGQLGMGILMKAIPQINVFAINIELKVIIGLALLMLLVAPFSQFLLEAENQMLYAMQELLKLSP